MATSIYIYCNIACYFMCQVVIILMMLLLYRVILPTSVSPVHSIAAVVLVIVRTLRLRGKKNEKRKTKTKTNLTS